LVGSDSNFVVVLAVSGYRILFSVFTVIGALQIFLDDDIASTELFTRCPYN